MNVANAPRPLLTVGRANRGDPNQYVSHCKICRRAVLKTELWEWSQQPLGIIHTLCTKGEPG